MRSWVSLGGLWLWSLSSCARAPCPDARTPAATLVTQSQPAPLATAATPRVVAPAPDTVSERALAYIHAIHGEHRLDTYARFSDTFRRSISEARFVEVLDGVKAQLGSFLEARVLDQHGSPARTSVHIAAFYERGTRHFTITLDPRNAILGLFVRPFGIANEGGPGPAPNYVAKQVYSLPLSGAWQIANGGSDPGGNRHVGNTQQWYAFDIHRLDATGNDAKGDGKRRQDYYAWDQPVLAPADGTVVTAVTGIPDQEIGSMDHYFVPGNTVVIDHGQGEFSFLCHLQKGSIVVKPGQGVRRGQLLGKVGNSGNTTAPHLHWHLGSDADVTRASGLPIRFGPLEVNGVRLEAPAPKQGDTVENP